MQISTLIFDWSGVISDDRRPVYETSLLLSKKYGLPYLTFDEWLPQTTLTPREFYAQRGVTVSPEQIYEDYTIALDEVRKKGINPTIYPDVKHVLQRLKENKKHLLVVSSHPEKNLREEAEDYGIAQFFDQFFGSTKDKTEGIHYACEVSNIPINEDVAYTGDTIYDIRAAKKAGVFSIGVSTGYHVRERLENEKPNAVIGSLTEILTIA